MNHSFNIDIAEKHGIKEAIIIENLGFWLKKNQANNYNIHDGYVWSYNSIDALQEIFPYMSVKQIRYALEKLEKSGLIKSGNYNKAKYDRTKWYAIIDQAILQHYKVHLPKWSNANDNSGKPIPDINTDIKQESESARTPQKEKPINQLSKEEKEAIEYSKQLKREQKQANRVKELNNDEPIKREPGDWVKTPDGNYRPPHQKDQYARQYNANNLRAYEYMREQAPELARKIKEENEGKIKDKDFLESFNDKYDLEGRIYDPWTIYCRLRIFARHWKKNNEKNNNQQQTPKQL